MNDFNDLEPVEVEAPAVLAAQVAGRCPADPPAIGQAVGRAFGELMGSLGRYALVPAGPPRAIYTSFGEEGVAFLVAMPVAAPPAVPPDPGSLTVDFLSGTKALRFTHRGPYRELMTTYGRITQFMQAKGLLTSESDWARYLPMWEEYLNDPTSTPEAELMTYIYVPLPKIG